jgi:AraC-like DNA-binding protein
MMLSPIEPTVASAGRLRLRTDDLERAREHIGSVFAAHTLGYWGPARRLDFAHHEARLDGLSLHDLRYGADVTVGAPALADFYLLQFTLEGTCEVRCGTRAAALPAGTLLVVNPSRPYEKRWGADCRQLIVRLDRAVLERQLEALPEFAFAPLALDRAGASLGRFAELMCRELAGGGAVAVPGVQRAFADALAALMLATVPHDRPAVKRSPAVPATVRRAETFMRAHAGHDLDLAAIAAAAGASARTLHRAFRRFRDTTPMASLKALRLDAVRAALLDPAQASRSVTALAAAHGLTHPGKFARDYKRRFGVLPSATWRRAR